MLNRPYVAAALLAALTLLPAAPALAQGEILITQAKANAGNVTPGDAAGYPVTISIPGTFQLASNLFVAANKIGIQVTSKNVTIDLNGFTLEGSDVAWYGIAGGVNAVTIENGTIEQFKFDGINGGTGQYWIVDNVRSIENGRDGMLLGQFAMLKSSVVVNNARRGVFAFGSSVIQGNTVSGNGDFGIYADQSAIVGNVINVNGGYGIDAASSTVVGNVFSRNGSYGLYGHGNSGYSGNTLDFNNAGGAQVADVLPQHPNVCFGAACP